MKYHDAGQNSLAPLEVIRGYGTMSDEKKHVIFPQPRQARVLSQMLVRPFRCHLSQQVEGHDSKGGVEVLDMIFKESSGEEQANQVALSPPYFAVSPPVRPANPVIQDSQFVYEKNAPAILSSSSSASSDFSSPHKGGRVRMEPELNPAAVRVEGFDCHISAVS